MNKKVLAVVLALGVMASAGYFGARYVFADDTNPVHQELVTRIAQKFNLKESDVQAVFDAVKDERQAQMEKEREDSLSKAVSDGVITEAQKLSLIAKLKEHLGQGQNGENRDDLRSWFQSQGIDETKIREYLRPAGRGERGPRMGMPN